MKYTILSETKITDELVGDMQSLLSQLVGKNVSVSKEYIAIIQETDTSEVILARDGEKCVGVGMIYRQKTFLEKKGWIEEVVVDEEYRGQGIGREIINKILNIVENEMITIVYLTSNKKRIPANKLYTSVGFTHHVETNFYYLLNK